MPAEPPKTPLEEAAANGDLTQLQTLLPTTPSDTTIQTLLSAATWKSHLAIIEYLLTHHAPAALEEEVVRAATYSNSIPIFSTLLAKYPSIVNMRFDRRGTPLTVALMARPPDEFLTYLLDAGAETNEDPLEWGGQPLAIAAYFYSDPKYIDLLVKHGAKFEQSGCLKTAACKNNLPMLRHLLKLGARPETDQPPYYEREMAVHTAAKKGYVEFLRILLENGADVDSKNKDGKTVLEVVEETEMKEKIDLTEVKNVLEEFAASN